MKQTICEFRDENGKWLGGLYCGKAKDFKRKEVENANTNASQGRTD